MGIGALKMTESNRMDPRLKLLSYSALLTLHKCPRKFQLYRLNATQETDAGTDVLQTLTFAFGHLVGDGIQMVFKGHTEEEIFWAQYRNWYADLAAENPKQNKSFYLGMVAVQKLLFMRANGYLEDWEIVEYQGKPAVELSFRITFPDGFTMRGSLDAVLRNRVTGEIMVLECKTSSAQNLNPAEYKNSSQGVGYSAVLDVLFPELSAYQVLYLVYKTKQGEYEQLPFTKTYLQRATWIQELLLDIETIKLYDSAGVYPMRGESCYDFYRECEYLNVCQLSTSNLTKKYDAIKMEPLDPKVYDFELTLDDLIMGQLKKNQMHEDKMAELVGVNVADGDELL
jgi:hypothetical protein